MLTKSKQRESQSQFRQWLNRSGNWIAEGEPSFVQQGSRRYFEASRQFIDDGNGGISGPALQVRYVCAMDARIVCERLLRQIFLLPQPTQVSSKAFTNIHIGRCRVLSTIGLQPISDKMA